MTNSRWQRSLTACKLGLAALLAGTACMAQAAPPQAAATGPYLQLGVGPSWQRSPTNTGSNGFDLHGSDTTFGEKATAGWQFTPMWGAELSYFHLGSAHINAPSGEVHYNTQVFTATGTLSYPLTTALTLSGRLGVGYSHSSVHIADYASSGHKYPLVAGIGARYALTPQLSLVVDYDYLGRTGRFQDGGHTSAQMLTFGVRYSF